MRYLNNLRVGYILPHKYAITKLKFIRLTTENWSTIYGFRALFEMKTPMVFIPFCNSYRDVLCAHPQSERCEHAFYKVGKFRASVVI